MLSKSYESGLYERLRDPVYAKEYLRAALEDDDEGAEAVFLLALRDIAKANYMPISALHLIRSAKCLSQSLAAATEWNHTIPNHANIVVALLDEAIIRLSGSMNKAWDNTNKE